MYLENNLLEQNVKKMAEKAYYGNTACPAQPHPVDQCGQQEMSGEALERAATSRYSLRNEAAEKAQHHSNKANQASAAYVFLSQHPEFEEFIQLIRSGSIQF